MLSYLSSLPIAVLRSLDTEANRFYDRNIQMYDTALLTRCYTQHALRTFIDSESNRDVNQCINWYSNIRTGYSNIFEYSNDIHVYLSNRPITMTYLVVDVLKI